MVSELVSSMENGKEFPFHHPKSLKMRPAIPSGNELASSIEGETAPLMALPAVKRTSLLSQIDSTRSVIPYVPGIQIRLPVAVDIKVPENGSCRSAADPDLDIEEDKKPEKEHKRRSKNWTRLETLKLIKLRSQLAPRFAKAGRKSELWDEIAEALQSRDAQQCRDKWEKLMAAYKEARDGLKEKKDNPYFEELHLLVSGNSSKKEKERESNSSPHENPLDVLAERASSDTGEDHNLHIARNSGGYDEALEVAAEEDGAASDGIQVLEQGCVGRKRKRGAKFETITDLNAVEALLETIISKQQQFFGDLLEAMERKNEAQEKMRQEREDRWRAEERAQRCIFNNAMMVLTQKLVGERQGTAAQAATGSFINVQVENQGPKKRSKNWKRTEVLHLIKIRGEMESRFAKSTRRAALWDELADLLATQGIQRDGKQCREKWDKLMSEHKDVVDGKREQSDSLYFSELTAVVGRKPLEDEIN